MTVRPTLGRSSAVTLCTRAHCSPCEPGGVSQRTCQSPCTDLTTPWAAGRPDRSSAASAAAASDPNAPQSRHLNASPSSTPPAPARIEAAGAVHSAMSSGHRPKIVSRTRACATPPIFARSADRLARWPAVAESHAATVGTGRHRGARPPFGLPAPLLASRVRAEHGTHSMLYVSTRGEAPVLGFADALLAGLARDGGLYVPEHWPAFDARDLRRLRRPPLCRRRQGGDGAVRGRLHPGRGASSRMVEDAYAGFHHPAVCPLVQLTERDWVLELFHGPTLAFKDVAMQLLGRLMDHVLDRAQRARHHRRRHLGRHRRRRRSRRSGAATASTW